jgi:isoleucyl-tRNA synthetase
MVVYVCWKYDISDLLPDNYKHLSESLIKGKENFDCWFNSSVSWYISNKNYIQDPLLLQKLNSAGITFKPSQGLNTDNLIKEYLRQLSQKLSRLMNDNTELTEVESILPKNTQMLHIHSKLSNPQSIDPPCSMVIEGHDQHFSWYVYSMLTSVSFNHQGFFSNLKTHGFITNSAGKKISKSSKEYVDPLDIIDGTIKTNGERQYGYGADTLRLYFCKKDSDHDFKLFEEDLVKAKEELKIIKRTAKLCLKYLDSYRTNNESYESYDVIEQIMINEYIKYLKNIEESVKEYKLDKYYRETFRFINDILLNYYLDTTKHFFYNSNDIIIQRMRFILKEVFLGTSFILSPVIPFNAENLYSYIGFIEKKNYIGFERLPTAEDAIRKFRFNFNSDFNFNAGNLLMMRKQIINKENRNELDLHMFSEEDSYENMLLKTLGEYKTYFFGVSHCFLDSEIAGKRSNISFKSTMPDGRKMKISMEYSLAPSEMYKCPKCYFKVSTSPDHRCEACERVLKFK